MIGANEATSLQQFRHKDYLIRILRAQDLQRSADALFLRTLMLPWIHCYKNKGNEGEQHRRLLHPITSSDYFESLLLRQ